MARVAGGAGLMTRVPTHADVEAAAVRIRTGVRRTPLLELHGDELGVPARVLLKLELTQHTGSFKARGALNALLAREELPAGVVAASGGNHGAAVAWAARQAGVAADIFVPASSPATKLERIREFGGELHVVDGYYPEAYAASRSWAEGRDVLAIHAYDDPDVVAGQGTIGLELLDQGVDPDLVLVACGGGGLYSGVATALSGLAHVQPIEPERCPNLHDALEYGERRLIEVGGVAADSLGAAMTGAITFEVARRTDTAPLLVTDSAIIEARSWLWENCRVLAEPGAATPLAALMCRRVQPHPGDTVVVVISGGNTGSLP